MPDRPEKIARFGVPVLEPEHVIRHLAKGVQHWKGGYSAHALATTWFAANGFPPKVRALLDASPAFRNLDLIDGIFERKTELGDGGRPSQTDLLVVARNDDGLAIIGVEGKAEEPFGQTLTQRIAERSEGGALAARLARLCALLRVEWPEGALRYQLFHRAAACLIEADRYGAKRALLLVHSFSERQSSLGDFKAFARALKLNDEALPFSVEGPLLCSVNGREIELYLGWVTEQAEHADFWDRLRKHADNSASYAVTIRDWIAKRS